MTKEVWALVAKGDVNAATRALESGATALVTEDPEALVGLSRVPVYGFDGAGKGPATALVRHGAEGDDAGGSLPFVRIDSPEDQDRARDLLAKHDTLVVDPLGWKVIPEENLVAWAGEHDARVIVRAADVEDALTALGALERGVDGVIVDADLVQHVLERLRQTPTLGLVEAEVTAVTSIGMGDRVCVDTCSLLDTREGLLVGSQASHLFLVLSENKESGYVNARPFRVNAGAVHQYALKPDGRTAYLSEVQGGLEVLVASTEGATRRAVVGRAKVEHRPLLLVRARLPEAAGGGEAHVVLQDAETIRIATPDGGVSVSDLAAGETVLVHVAPGARHFGVAIEERVIER